jgi:hypothetical protein
MRHEVVSTEFVSTSFSEVRTRQKNQRRLSPGNNLEICPYRASGQLFQWPSRPGQLTLVKLEIDNLPMLGLLSRKVPLYLSLSFSCLVRDLFGALAPSTSRNRQGLKSLNAKHNS